MTLLSSVPRRSREFDKLRRGHLVPLLASALIAAIAMTLVAWLLWPTWAPKAFDNNEPIPVSIGETLFNVPPHAFRRKVQRHSGPQESIDLNFLYPSLAAPDAPRRVTAETIDETTPPIDRIFLSIAAHHDSLAPYARLRTIYPRYLDETRTEPQDGLSVRAFRDRTPYAGEDLFVAEAPALDHDILERDAGGKPHHTFPDPALVARCTRDAATPGMCLSERRIGSADLTFRFPRQWLTEWRNVAGAMEGLAQQLHGSHN
jgi:hypothetical protein